MTRLCATGFCARRPLLAALKRAAALIATGVLPDPAQRAAEIAKRARAWAKDFDGNSLVVLRRASVRYDAEKDFAGIKAKLLYVHSRTDKVFRPTIAPDVMAKLNAVSVLADYFEIDSELGHSASGLDAAKWAPRVKAFMASLPNET